MREIPANGKDDDCDGLAASLTSPAIELAFTDAHGPKATIFSKLALTGAPGGATVTLTCKAPKKAKGCPFATTSAKARAGKVMSFTSKVFKNAKLPAGTVVEARVTAGATVAIRVERLTVRAGARAQASDELRQPGHAGGAARLLSSSARAAGSSARREPAAAGAGRCRRPSRAHAHRHAGRQPRGAQLVQRAGDQREVDAVVDRLLGGQRGDALGRLARVEGLGVDGDRDVVAARRRDRRRRAAARGRGRRRRRRARARAAGRRAAAAGRRRRGRARRGPRCSAARASSSNGSAAAARTRVRQRVVPLAGVRERMGVRGQLVRPRRVLRGHLDQRGERRPGGVERLGRQPRERVPAALELRYRSSRSLQPPQEPALQRQRPCAARAARAGPCAPSDMLAPWKRYSVRGSGGRRSRACCAARDGQPPVRPRHVVRDREEDVAQRARGRRSTSR